MAPQAVPWQGSELMVFRLEYHFFPAYASSAQIIDFLKEALLRCFGTRYRNYSRDMVKHQLYEERKRGKIPHKDIKPVPFYTRTVLHDIASHRLSEQAKQPGADWTGVDHTIRVAFPYFRGELYMSRGRPCSDPRTMDGFDIVQSANFIEDFTVEVWADRWPRHIREHCMELFHRQAGSTNTPHRRYGNRAIADRLVSKLKYPEDFPNLITAAAVEYCIWSHIRTLPPNGRLQRAIEYCCGGSEE